MSIMGTPVAGRSKSPVLEELEHTNGGESLADEFSRAICAGIVDDDHLTPIGRVIEAGQTAKAFFEMLHPVVVRDHHAHVRGRISHSVSGARTLWTSSEGSTRLLPPTT